MTTRLKLRCTTYALPLFSLRHFSALGTGDNVFRFLIGFPDVTLVESAYLKTGLGTACRFGRLLVLLTDNPAKLSLENSTITIEYGQTILFSPIPDRINAANMGIEQVFLTNLVSPNWRMESDRLENGILKFLIILLRSQIARTQELFSP